MSDYQPRIVALLDVLGASAALLNYESSERFAEALDNILSPIILNEEEPWLVLPQVLTGEEVEIDGSPPLTTGALVTTISDSIVLSIPFPETIEGEERLRRIFDCLQYVFFLQRGLLALGLRTRGGIAIGGLIHRPHLVVGDALVRVHEIESKQAIFPRTIIDPQVIRILCAGPCPHMAVFENRIAHLIRQDKDMAYFVDYLAPALLGAVSLNAGAVLNAVMSDLRSATDPRVKSKLEWMLDYFFTAAEDRTLTRPSKAHAERSFSDLFPRTSENLDSWAETEFGPNWKSKL
jgi:hypothetical protein